MASENDLSGGSRAGAGVFDPGEERFILRSAGVACKVPADGTFVLFRRVQREGNRRTDEALGNSGSNKAPQSKAEAEGKVKGGMEMSGEEQNRSFYKETFEEIPVPEGLAEKVGSITEREEKRQRTVVGSVLRKVAIAAAILVALLVGSNGVAYAMTGKTWVKTMIVTFNIGDSVYEVEVEEQQLNNEESIYSGDFVTENGDKDHAEVYEQGQEVVFAYTNGAEVRSAYGKRTYILDEGIEIDITKDIEEDGKAVGTYEVNGILKGYSIVAIDEFGGLSVLVEILEEGMEGPDWPTKWAMKQIEDGTASYVPLLTPIPLPEPK